MSNFVPSSVARTSASPDRAPRFVRSFTLSAALALVVAASAFAASVAGLEGWYPGQPYDQSFSADHVTRVAGRVLSVERFVPREGMAEGVRVLVATPGESLWVHLGPAAFVDAQRVRLAAGDDVRVTGAAAKDGERPFLLATRVDRAGEILRLREQDGTPAWLEFRPRAR